MIVVGLTGSIAMGKSTLAAIFRELGVPVFDADATVHQIYRSDFASQIECAFPGVVLDGAVDRQRLAAHVVGDVQEMKKLEAIVHPAVAGLRLSFLATARALGARLAMLDVPLLFETHGDREVDVVVTASASPAIQRARALARPGASIKSFQDLLERQMADVEKRRLSHFVIDTSGEFADSRRQATDLLRAMVGAEGRHA